MSYKREHCSLQPLVKLGIFYSIAGPNFLDFNIVVIVVLQLILSQLNLLRDNFISWEMNLNWIIQYINDMLFNHITE